MTSLTVETKAGIHDGEDQHEDGRVHAHISPTILYLAIFGGLIGLTLLTVGVSYFDFGSANLVVAMVVATMKATLVAAFFMHLTHDKLFHTVLLLASFLFLGLFFTLTYEDTGQRNKLDEVNGSYKSLSKGEMAPGGIPADKLNPPAAPHKAAGKEGDHKAEGAKRH